MRDSFVLAVIATSRIITSSTLPRRIAMSVSEFTDPKRICLTLDPGLVLERMILQRLSGLKRKRGQDWLRSLLVHGFLVEGRWICSGAHGTREKKLVPRETTLPVTPFASWLVSAKPTDRTDAKPVKAATMAVVETPNKGLESKPFAHLRKVIG
jgi:hypothetical protein